MFITRKQYEMDLRRAKAEGRREALKEVHTEDRMDRIENGLYRDMDRFAERMERRIDHVLQELRVEEIKCSCDCECVETERCND